MGAMALVAGLAVAAIIVAMPARALVRRFTDAR